jgi:hypothetical protein
MKTIKAVSIWDNGVVEQATVLNAYAINVDLNQSATFWYGLMTESEDGSIDKKIAEGNLTMSGADYGQWDLDSYAWDWIAVKLGIVITGDYVAPIPIEPVAPIPIEPVAEPAQDIPA